MEPNIVELVRVRVSYTTFWQRWSFWRIYEEMTKKQKQNNKEKIRIWDFLLMHWGLIKSHAPSFTRFRPRFMRRQSSVEKWYENTVRK